MKISANLKCLLLYYNVLLCHCAMFKKAIVTFFQIKLKSLKFNNLRSTQVLLGYCSSSTGYKSEKTLVSDSSKEGRDDRYRVPKYSLIQC